jgi:hypothetical protein
VCVVAFHPVVVIEDDDAARSQEALYGFQDGAGGGVEVTVQVGEGEGREASGPLRQGVLVEALDESCSGVV